MRRVSIREWRTLKPHELHEPVEIVRYTRTVGYFIPAEYVKHDEVPAVVRKTTYKWSEIKRKKGAASDE